MAMRVAVAGGGLGGLCLAQGLRRHGVDVTVYERDATAVGRRQGYRLHLDARAGLALRECLPPKLFGLFQHTCSTPSTRFTVVSEKLRELRIIHGTPGVDTYAAETLATSVNRQTLREILAAGLDDRIVYGQEATGFADGVRLVFADGREVECDVLVAADGVNSAVRRQYLPQATAVDTGGRCVYGMTLLTDQALDLVPPPLLEGFMAVVGGRVGMATGLVRLRERPEQAAARIAPKATLSPVRDYLMWSLSADMSQFKMTGAELDALDPAGLHELVGRMIKSWHLNLRGLHELAEIDETFLIKVRTSTPVPAWRPSRVTVLGDAIHAMSPAGGSGANIALRDASVLCKALASAPSDNDGLLAAIGGYEAEMREYGYAAVEASNKAAADMAGRRGGLMFWLYRQLARG